MSEIIPPEKSGHGGEERKNNICIKCGQDITFWDYMWHSSWRMTFNPYRFFMYYYCSECWKTVSNKKIFEVKFK